MEASDKQMMKQPVFIPLSLVVTVLVIGVIYVGRPDKHACTEVASRLAEEDPYDMVLSAAEIIDRIGIDTIAKGDFSDQGPLLVELFELRKKWQALQDRIVGIMEGPDKKITKLEEEYEQQEQEARIKQRGLDLESQRIELAQQGGYSPLTRQQAREELARLAVERQTIEVELAEARVRLSEQRSSSIEQIIKDLESARDELQQIDTEIAEKSRALLERDLAQACQWFGKWR